MKNKSNIFYSVFFSVIALMIVVSPFIFHKSTGALVFAANEDINAQINSLKSDLSKIEKERSDAQKALNAARSSKANQIALKRQYDSEIESIQSLLKTTEALITQYDENIAQTETDIANLKIELENQQTAFDEMVRMSFMYGNDDYLEMIFDAKSFSDFLSRVDMISYLLSYNQGIIDNMTVTETQLQNTTAELKLSKENLKNYKESKEALKADYDKKSAEASQLITELLNDENAAAQALKIVEENASQIQADIDALAKQLNDNSKYEGGVFIWPLDYNSRTSSGWEWRTNPITKKKEFHNGLDLPAPGGTSIFAAADGTVVKSAWYGGYGNCIIVNHGGGVMTLYGHCSKLNATEGQSVKQGDTIAYVGTTGLSTGNHLHFTVYENGNVAVNPWNYLGSKS